MKCWQKIALVSAVGMALSTCGMIPDDDDDDDGCLDDDPQTRRVWIEYRPGQWLVFSGDFPANITCYGKPAGRCGIGERKTLSVSADQILFFADYYAAWEELSEIDSDIYNELRCDYVKQCLEHKGALP